MNNNAVWSQYGERFVPDDITNQVPKLEPHIYRVEFNELANRCELVRLSEKFDLPSKVYALESKLIDRVQKRWNKTTENLGVLMNGFQGTGKTVTAKHICNKMELPVIVVTRFIAQLPIFLAGLGQPVVVLVDEYEKIYRDYEHSILTVMDGVLNTPHRKFFILTTNQLTVSPQLIQRPGRIFYLKEFSDLTRPVIEEIVDDLLENKEFRDQVVKFLSSLQNLTIDIVKAVISECNIHNEPPEDFKEIINVRRNDEIWNIYEMLAEEGKDELRAELALPQAMHNMNKGVTKGEEGQYFTVSGSSYDFDGKITKVFAPNLFEVQVEDADDDDGKKFKILKIERTWRMHGAFYAY